MLFVVAFFPSSSSKHYKGWFKKKFFCIIFCGGKGCVLFFFSFLSPPTFPAFFSLNFFPHENRIGIVKGMHAADGDIVIHSDLLKWWCVVDSGHFADSCVARGTASGFDSGCCLGVTAQHTACCRRQTMDPLSLGHLHSNWFFSLTGFLVWEKSSV